MRALLVEDDDMIGRSLVHALKGAGWSVDWVRDGALAHSALADGDYRCVLLDLGLPGLDGTEVLRGGAREALTAREFALLQALLRSEERRVGKECRSRWSPYH